MPIWRYIPPISASGSLQMAIDQWLLDQHRQGHPPTLRFYTWEPAAISLGYHQRRWPAHWNHLTWNDRPLDLVRRPTGGRAVLHQGDLTYAVITSGLTGDRTQNYHQLCEFLLRGWRSLGVELHYGQAGRGYIQNPNCFGTATGADLLLPEGFKLIGSAQLYREQTILQHGSMRLKPNPELFQQVFQENLLLPVFAGGLEWIVPETIMTALKDALIQTFAIELVEQPLSQQEWQSIVAQLPPDENDSVS